MSRATVRRFLLTLVAEGYAETDGKYFGLRPKVLELGDRIREGRIQLARR